MSHKKGSITLGILILIAAAGIYLSFLRQDLPNASPNATSSSPAESWYPVFPPLTSAPDGIRPSLPEHLTPGIAPDKSPDPTTFSQNSAKTTPTTQRTTTYTFPPTQVSLTQPVTVAGNNNYPYGREYGLTVHVAAVPLDPYLIYVSKTVALPANYQVRTEICVARYPEKKELETTAAQAYRAMHAKAELEGAELIPYSGYRSTARQKQNFDNKIQYYRNQGNTRDEAIAAASTSILPPGCSEHEAGLAMDITRPGYWDTRDDFVDSKEYRWLQGNAHLYGFILRYPAEKTERTGVKFEPWHWRYVGIGPATAMHTSGECLEEYLKITP